MENSQPCPRKIKKDNSEKSADGPKSDASKPGVPPKLEIKDDANPDNSKPAEDSSNPPLKEAGSSTEKSNPPDVAENNDAKTAGETPDKQVSEGAENPGNENSKEATEPPTTDELDSGAAREKLADERNSDQQNAALIDLGAARPRFVPEEKIRRADADDPNACRVVTSQDRVSIIANGGSFGIVVGLANYEKAYVLRATSLAPNDVSIAYEPDIGSVDGRAFFVIKSKSEKTGEFEIEFETPCGTKKVKVDVR